MVCYKDGVITTNMNCSTRRFLFSKHLKQITAGVLLLLSSMARSPEVDCSVFYPRQSQSNNKFYLPSEVIRGNDFVYPLASNIGTYKLFNKNQETGQRFPANNLNIKDVANGYDLERPLIIGKRRVYDTKRTKPHIPSRLLEMVPDITLLTQLLESGLLQIDNGEQGYSTDGIPFTAQSQQHDGLPGRRSAYDEFIPEKRRMGGGSGCLFHAGLAHNCDYKDLVGAVDETDHWSSDIAPGKKKRRRKRAASLRTDNSKRNGQTRDASSKHSRLIRGRLH